MTFATILAVLTTLCVALLMLWHLFSPPRLSPRETAVFVVLTLISSGWFGCAVYVTVTR